MKVAIIAEQNFNLIDGSTIWLLNVCKLLALMPGIEATLILSNRLETRTLADEVPENITIVDAADLQVCAPFIKESLDHTMLLAALSAWEFKNGAFDRLFIRGEAYLVQLLQSPAYRERIVGYAPSVVPDVAKDDPEWIRLGRDLRVPVIVQSDTAKAALESLYDYPANVVSVVPPIVFQDDEAPNPNTKKTVTLCYSGKIDLYYGLDWLVDICTKAAKLPSTAVSIVAGKDTYRSRSPEFFKSMDALRAKIKQKKLKRISLVTGVSHAKAKQVMAEADFAYCLRHARFDDNIEISTKVVEFCTLNVPLILNDNALNRSLFGNDYPYFIDISKGGIPDQVLEIMTSKGSAKYKLARKKIRAVAAQFSADILARKLETGIRGYDDSAAKLTQNPRHIRIATHERKFLGKFVDRIRGDNQISLEWEDWESTGKPESMPQISARADTVFCEWCCENAVWHSKNKRSGSKLIIRLHRFEAFRDFPTRVEWRNVDALIVVSDHFKEIAINKFGMDAARIHVLPQYIDWHGLQRPKTNTARFTLGLVGINPFEHKRFDRAVAFFAELHKRDNRFKLAVRSVMPWEIDWVWNGDPATRQKFTDVFHKIFSDPELSAAIRFDTAGNDMEEWYRDIGTILSSSDSEGCHTSVIEGMASGCYPVVYDWPGARSLFSPYVHKNMADAIDDVIAFADSANIDKQRKVMSQAVKIHDVEEFAQKFFKL